MFRSAAGRIVRSVSRSAKSVVVYGPARCGKTRFAQVLAAHYRLERVEDLERLDARIERTGVLYLAQARPTWAEEDDRPDAAHRFQRRRPASRDR